MPTTCRERWTYIWEPKGQELSPANRGVALKDGKLVRGTADGYLIALDMAKGYALWSQKIADAKTSQYSQHAAADLRRSRYLRPGRRRLGRQELDRRLQA